MGSPDWSSADAVIEALDGPEEAPDVFLVIRHLQALLNPSTAVGTAKQPQHEPLRFVQPPSLAFSTRSIAHARRRADGTLELGLNCFGLFGPAGPLPLHLTSAARAHDQKRDGALAAFFNIFNHRTVSLLYRVWAAHRLCPSAERPELDHYLRFLSSLAGIDPAWAQRHELLHLGVRFAGRLTHGARNPEGLAAMLRSYFECQAQIQEFRPEWLDVPPAEQCRLGRNEPSARLGQTSVVGARVLDVQGRIRVRLGPLPLKTFERLLPGEETLHRLHHLITAYCGRELHYDVQLVLQRLERPLAQLGCSGRLGCTAWIGSREAKDHPDDLVIPPPDHHG